LAAILGREFDFLTQTAASDQDEVVLIEALEQADRAQLIEERSREGELTYAFVHTLIPTTLIENMRMLRRRQLHARAAIAIENHRPDDYEILAYDYNQAGKADKAAYYLLQAGDKAREFYAHQEAIENYQQAGEIMDYSPPPPVQRALKVTAIEPGSVNPHIAMDHPAAVLMDQLFSGLVEITSDSSVVPDVAHSWEVLDGGRKYVFHLRDDVFWTDGVKMTAGDFEFAWKYSLDPPRRWSPAILRYDIKGARAYYEGEIADPDLVGVRALDDFTLSVDLEGPTSYFPYLLAFSTMFPIPERVVQKLGSAWTDLGKFVTNGPFKLVSWEHGQSMVLERNPAYHGNFAGNLDRIECYFLAGQGALALQMYEQDKLDICSGLPLVEMDRARLRYAEDYVSGPWPATDFIGFDVSRPPFNDRLVRRAFILATDRERLAHVAVRGYAFPAMEGIVPPGIVGHTPGIGLPYDPKAARQLLQKQTILMEMAFHF
jgi:ABC-type transport system substrate-binding protein